MINGITFILLLFVLLTFVFLVVVRKEIIYRAKRNRWVILVLPFLALLVFWLTLAGRPTVDELLRGVAASLVFISFLFDSKGMTETGLVLNSFDLKGVPYGEIERIVLYKPKDSSIIKLNFFRNGWRGPLLKFQVPLEELVLFLSTHMNEEAEIDIMTDAE